VLVRLGHGVVEEHWLRLDGPRRVRDILASLGLPASAATPRDCSGRPLPLDTLLFRDSCIVAALVESPG